MKSYLLLLISIFFISSFSYSQVANTPSDLHDCDDDDDGIAIFDLSVNNSIILGGQNPSEYTVTYHETLADANGYSNIITNSTAYVSSTTTIYVRVTENSSGNFDTTSFDLVVHMPPSISQQPPFEICDDNNDGVAVFDLSTKTIEIIGGETNVVVSYYATQSEAEINANPIPNTWSNTTNPQTIYVRVEDTVTYCYSIITLDLIVLDCSDEDNDGVINSNEDINGNSNLDDDDTDEDGTPDYLDDDDDGDNIDTADELINPSASGKSINNSKKLNTSIIDTDNDTIENYLDDDDDGDGVLTKDEDYNNNGTPLDDDTNNNSIPDYLENSVALSVNDVININFLLYPNPTKDVLFIETKSEIKIEKIKLYSITGKLLFENNDKEVNLKIFPKGIYFLNIISGNKSFTKKIIKN